VSIGPVAKVSLDATVAVVLSVAILVPAGAIVVAATGWGLPPESNPLATVETARCRETVPGAARRLVERLRAERPGDRIELVREEDGTVTIRRIGVGGSVLLPLPGRTAGLSAREVSVGPLWVESIVPYLPDVPPDASASEQTAALIRGVLRFIDEAPETPLVRALRKVVRLGVALLLGTTSLCFLLVALWRLGRGAVPEPLRWEPPLRLAALGVAGGIGCLGVGLAVERLFALIGLPIPEQPLVEAVLSTRHGALLAAGVLVLLAPIAEELFFRGYVFRYLRGVSGRRTAYLVSVLLFAGLHLHPAALAVYALYGTAFAWLTERTGSIVPSTLAHVTVNGTALLVALI